MKKIKLPANFLSALALITTLFVVSSCIGDQSVARRKGFVKDFTIDTNPNGCGDTYLIYDTPFDTCTSKCEEGTHLATLDELAEIKKELVAAEGKALNGVDVSLILTRVNGSLNLCVSDVVKEVRPTGAIDIKNDFCSCLNGKSDVINDCEATCASKPVSDQPILYVNTTLGLDIAGNEKLGNLYNWCSVQLADDDTTPQCFLSATDGASSLFLPVNVTPGSNSFSVNLSSLAKNRTWLLKLMETKTGSNASSKEFQIRRKDQTTENSDTVGALKVTPVSQYTCMTYGGKVDTLGNIIRTTYARIFYYFAANETPAPVPPAGGSNQSQIVCHDEQLHPGNDSAEYPRMELIPGALAMWDKTDTRFVAKAENAGKLTINKILQDRLASDFNITGASIDLFRLITYPNRPSSASTSASTAKVPLGYMMIPFRDGNTGKSYCPTSTQYNGTQPLLNLLGEFMGDTEGLYLGEKEAETILDNGTYKPVYGTMFVRESVLTNYGFYIENGLKIKANAAAMHSKTIYYYWPTSTTADPLTQGNRKLFTVRRINELQGNIPEGQATTEPTTDKRFGCVPKI